MRRLLPFSSRLLGFDSLRHDCDQPTAFKHLEGVPMTTFQTHIVSDMFIFQTLRTDDALFCLANTTL